MYRTSLEEVLLIAQHPALLRDMWDVPFRRRSAGATVPIQTKREDAYLMLR